ncbi:MAG: hypothetical protein F6K53_31560 [Moorea sp. SIO4A1]|nr:MULTISPECIES: hypothetical protein [unclassified Moorena]NEO21370.1 hypothetical protein [Moorena sp. SIO4A5]NEQ61725.1 hypothetical protein [Moorena sp. SIO4A1]
MLLIVIGGLFKVKTAYKVLLIFCKHSAVSGQRSAVSGQRSAVSGQWSVVSGQWSAVSGQRSAVSRQLLLLKSCFRSLANS